MPKITVRKCPFSNKLFENDAEYIQHLNQLRQAMRQKRQYNNFIHYARPAVCREVAANATSITELVDYINKHWQAFDINHMTWSKDKDKFQYGIYGSRLTHEDSPFIHLEFTNMRWMDKVSNSHSHPWDGVSNWSRKDNKPGGYPGWVGRVTITVNPVEYYLTESGKKTHNVSSNGHISDILSSMGIKTGSGGGGGTNKDGFKRYSYDVKLFVDDFTTIKQQLEKQYTAMLLRDADSTKSYTELFKQLVNQ